MNEADIIEALTEPLKLSEQAIIFPLQGGTINLAFLLNDQDTDYLVKVLVGNDEFDIDRKERFAFQSRLAIRKLAPKPIYLSDDQSLYVEQWINQSKQQIPLFFDELHIEQFAKTLARIHVCQFDLPAIDLPKMWQQYLDKFENPSDKQVFAEKYESISSRWNEQAIANKHSNCLCHNDLSWGHLCPGQTIIFDWEYAGMGNPYFDLMSCAKVNKFDEAQTDCLIAVYAKYTKDDYEIIKEACMQQYEFVDFTYSLWFALLNAHLK